MKKFNNFDEFVSQFSGLQKSATGYTATCPVCGKAKHLYLKPVDSRNKDDNTVLLYCQHCGSKANEILPAMGLKLSDLYFSDPSTLFEKWNGKVSLSEQAASHPREEWYITEQSIDASIGNLWKKEREHFYTGYDWSIIGKKVIYRKIADESKKKAMWFRYENENYYLKMPQGEKPLYHTYELMNSKLEIPVFITEGEKDADTLSSFGLVATTLPNGAAQKSWSDAYGELFSDRRIVILMDNDEAGERYGDYVCQKCLETAERVTLIPAKDIYPQVPAKGDITDIVDLVGVDEAKKLLVEALKNAVPIERTKVSIDKLNAYTLPDLSAEEKKPPEFIVEGMIPVGLTFISGPPKTRKSFFALQLAACVSNGTCFLGKQTTKSKVVYFDLEGSKSRISSRADKMNFDFTRDIVITNSIKEKVSDGLAEIIRNIHKEDNDYRLFIVDTYSRARGEVKSKTGNAYDCDVQLLEPIQRMAIDEKLAVVFIHHFKKGASFTSDSFEKASGTMGITGSCDSVLNIIGEGKRFDARAKLEYTPRDAQGGEMDLIFDEYFNVWTVDESVAEMKSSPIVRYCLRNAPKAGAAPVFFTYSELYYGSYGYNGGEESERVRQALCKQIRDSLYRNNGIMIQLGARLHGQSGVRIMRC